MTSHDSRDFFSADRITIIDSDNSQGNSADILKVTITDPTAGNVTPCVAFSDEWSTVTEKFAGNTEEIGNISLSDLMDVPAGLVWDAEKETLTFVDDSISQYDATGCKIDGTNSISLETLTGDVEILTIFDRINQFGKIYDLQFKKINFGQYKFANSRICTSVANSLGFLSVDKLINDEYIRMEKQNSLHALYKDDSEKSGMFKPYSGFLVSEAYISSGWIEFDYIVHRYYENENAYDDEASLSIITKKIKEAKRAMVLLCLNYSSSIVELASFNKITDFGVRVIDKTTGQQLDFSNFKNDLHNVSANSGIATFTGKLEYVSAEAVVDPTCNPCSTVKVDKCTGEMSKVVSCDASSSTDDTGVAHVISPQFRVNPLAETRKSKPDILNTVDPIHWTTGTQDFTEKSFPGITALRDEFSEDELTVNRLNENRGFALGGGVDHTDGFVAGGFYHQLESNDEIDNYGHRTSTEEWNGTTWSALAGGDIPSSRGSGLGGGERAFKVVAFGTKGTFTSQGSVETSDPVPTNFETTADTSSTLACADGVWYVLPYGSNTNTPRHSVGGFIKSSYRITGADGKTISSCGTSVGAKSSLSDLLGEDVADDVDISLCPEVLAAVSSFIRDAGARAAGQIKNTNLKTVGPAFDPNAMNGVGISENSLPVNNSSSGFNIGPNLSIGGSISCGGVSLNASFGNTSVFGQDFAVPLCPSVSNKLPNLGNVFVGAIKGLDASLLSDIVSGISEEPGTVVESWKDPLVLPDGSIVFKDDSGNVDPGLIRTNASGKPTNVDKGSYYEFWNISGIAFNGSIGGLKLDGIKESELSDTFEYISYIRVHHHVTVRKSPTTYKPYTYRFEQGCWNVDVSRKYPIKTVGTYYVGDECSGLATGGKTSNTILGCDGNSASLNMKYGYFDATNYDEFDNSIVNIAYENNGSAWVRRDNLPENVCYHVGVGDKDHAVFWGGIHASLETPNVSVSFPGCEDWYKLVSDFGGVFHRRGNKGLDKEVRYSFFATKAVDSYGNTYYKAGDQTDSKKDGIDYSDDYIEAGGTTSLSGRNWSGYINDKTGHVYSVSYANIAKDVDEPQSEISIVYFTSGESWIGSPAACSNLSNANPTLPAAEREAAAVDGENGESEVDEQVGAWVKNLLTYGFDSYEETWRPDLETNSFPLSGYWPKLNNYFLNGSDKRPVWKYSGHPVDGAMWIWSRPTIGESLFDPKHLHPEPIDSVEWQALEKWKNHSFYNHSGLEYFYTKFDDNYSDIIDNSLESVGTGNYKKTAYWVIDSYDPTGDNTFTTLYDYDPFKIEKFLADFGGEITYETWQNFLAVEGGRLRVRSEDPYFKHEYLRSVLTGNIEELSTFFKKGTLSSLNVASSGGNVVVNFTNSISPCLSFASSYTLALSTTATLPNYGIAQSDTGFTLSLSGAYVGDITWEISENISDDIATAWCENRKTYEEISTTIGYYHEDNNISSFIQYSVDNVISLIKNCVDIGLIPKESVSDPIIAHVPEEGLTPPILVSSAYNYYCPTPYDVSIYSDIFVDPAMATPLSQLILRDWYPTSLSTTGTWALPRYTLQNVLTRDSNGVLVETAKKILTYAKTDNENPNQFFYSHNLATSFDDYNRRFYLPKVKQKFIDDFSIDTQSINNGLLVLPELNKRYIKKYYPDSILSNNLACYVNSGIVLADPTYIDTGRYSSNVASCSGFAFRTNENLASLLSYGNNQEIIGGKFDMFWYNNVTRHNSEVDPLGQYKSGSQYDESLDVLAQNVYMPSKNKRGFDDFHYFYKVSAWTAQVSSADLTPNSESFWILGGYAPVSACQSVNTSAGDLDPVASCYNTVSLSPGLSAFDSTTVDSISYQASGGGYIFTASGRYLSDYTTSTVAEISAGFAYHYGYERTLLDVSPDDNLSDRFDQFDYFRYRFEDADDSSWLYMPNSVSGEYNGGDAIEDMGFATSTHAPSGITYSFYITRNCEGLQQFIWGSNKNTFVERWKYPVADEIIEAVGMNSEFDGVTSIGTMVGDSSGNKSFVELSDVEQFRYGTLSVGKFEFPEITTEQINASVENPLKGVIRGIEERQSDEFSVFGVATSASSAAWLDLYNYLDSSIDEDAIENYFPLSYDTYQGNPYYLPTMPFFKVDESDTNIRFLPDANSSSIRDRATLWPWCDLLDGDARNDAASGDVTWQFTTDSHFWLAETVSRIWVQPKACRNFSANTDPLHRDIKHTNMYPDGYWRETFRVRRWSERSELVFDYTITYDNAAGPEIKGTKRIATDFNMFGMNIKNKTIELQHFNNKPINGPTQTWVSDLDEDKSWLASNWFREEISNLRLGITDIAPEITSISGCISELYNYRHESLCEMITGGYNKTIFVPSEGTFCQANLDSIWAYSVPFGDQTGRILENESFFIEASPYVRSAVISGTDAGFDDLGDITENIRVISNGINYTCITDVITGGTTYLSGGSFYISGGSVVASGGQPCGFGSQIIHAKTYTANGTSGVRLSRAIIAGPYSRGMGMLDYGKSQAYNKELLHRGTRKPCTYKVNENNTFHPADSTIGAAWPWNIIGQAGTIGPKGYTDLLDSAGNYWFAMGEKDNYREIEEGGSGNVNYKNSYVIGMVKVDNIPELLKTALAKSNYVQARETVDAIARFSPDSNYNLIGSGNTGSRFREAILELIHTSNGEVLFELYVKILEENVVDISNPNYNNKYSDISNYEMPKDTNGVIVGVLVLPLEPLAQIPSVNSIQELTIVNEKDPSCLECLTCANQTSDYSSTVINPTPWTQHNHDQWISPFLESPFSGPYSIEGFNIWLSAGNSARWGSPIWSTVKDGKFWISYRRARIHANPYRNHVVLTIINSSICVDDFADVEDSNIPVYVTYDEFIFNYDDYKNLNIIKELVEDENKGALGRDCTDNLAAYIPIQYPEFEDFNVGDACTSGASGWDEIYNDQTYTANISGFSSFPTSGWTCPGTITYYSVSMVPVSASNSISLSNYIDCGDIETFSVTASSALLSSNYVFITSITSQVTGCSGLFVCPDSNPNEKYTEWATSFIQEYKSRTISDSKGFLKKYYFKYDVMNTIDSNTLLELPDITEKKIVANDWRRFQDGVGLGGDAPALNVYGIDERPCNSLNQYYIGQTAFGTTSKAVIVGGFSVQVDGELTKSHCWWERTTVGTTFKWNKEVISPEDSLNSNYRNRNFSPFFTNAEQTLTPTTHGVAIFDLSKQITIERQGIAEFGDTNSVTVTFDTAIPDWVSNKDKYSISLMPNQNVKVWWDNKTETGFDVVVELESWTGTVDWQITLVDDIPASEVDDLGENETFDKFNNL